ncbi:MAG: response regulator [Candidatus Rokubacteria bacterium]|nr:response regulator [Candidatus Rokubacteria bacterium]
MPPQPAAVAPSEPPLAGLRVLVVEDRADLRELFSVLLGADGARAVAAGTAAQAVALLDGPVFDAILTDLGLPDMAGDELIRRVRTVAGRGPAIAVITGYGEPHVSRALAAGADAVLAKPVRWERVRTFLTARRLAPIA